MLKPVHPLAVRRLVPLPPVKVQPEVERRLRELADHEGEGLSLIVRRALRHYLATLDRQEHEARDGSAPHE